MKKEISGGDVRSRLGLFSVVMINIIAVDSLRSLPFSAMYSFSLIFFYCIAALTFLIPSGFAAAELATGWPRRGGIYVWVTEAFGPRWGFVIIWLQWIYNVVWYPTLLSFLAGAVAYIIDPSLVNNHWYMFWMIFFIFWGATFLNFFGMRTSSLFSGIGAIIGTLLPMGAIIFLGICWVSAGYTPEIEFSLDTFFPSQLEFDDISFYIALLFGLMGLEMSAVHADEVRKPQTTFPKAIIISSCIIICSLILSSLAIAIVVPKHELNVVSGLLQAYDIFLSKFGASSFLPLLALCIIIGSVGNMSAWVLGPSKGLMVAIRENKLSLHLGKESIRGVPIPMLLAQGVIVTLLSSIFLFLPTVSSSYWILSVITGELALFVYIGLFASLIKLRITHPHIKRHFMLPGGVVGTSIIGGVGIIACFAGCIAGLIPPKILHTGSVYTYEMLVIGGTTFFTLIPFLLFSLRKRKSKVKVSQSDR